MFSIKEPKNFESEHSVCSFYVNWKKTN